MKVCSHALISKCKQISVLRRPTEVIRESAILTCKEKYSKINTQFHYRGLSDITATGILTITHNIYMTDFYNYLKN